LLTVVDVRLEKRRQAMLEMPQMIQTWKEVCFNATLGSSYRSLTLNDREDMVVDGRSGPNRWSHDEYCIRYQT
jgi:hypothetical protein